jgi:hypothetical protein
LSRYATLQNFHENSPRVTVAPPPTMANANTNRFFPIFPDGEDPTPSGSNSRSKKPAAKRTRQETPSPPHAPPARPTPAPLAIEAPPPRDDSAITSRLDAIELTLRKHLIEAPSHRDDSAITSRLDEIELTLRKHLIRLDSMDEELETTSGGTGMMVDHWITLDRGFTDVSKKIDVVNHLVSALLDRPAPAAAPAPVAASDPQMVAAIAALSKKVDDLLARSTASPAATVAASAPEQTAAIAALSKKVDGLLERPTIASAPESQNLAALSKQVTAVSQQLTSLTARHSTTAAPTKKPAPAATTAKPASAAAATPAKPTTATAAQNLDAWNPVVSKKTKRRQQIYPPHQEKKIAWPRSPGVVCVGRAWAA